MHNAKMLDMKLFDLEFKCKNRRKCTGILIVILNNDTKSCEVIIAVLSS